MKLTAKTVQAAKSARIPRKIYDGHGLHLHVTKTGCFWRYSYRYGGKQRDYTFGPADLISLAEARTLHQATRLLVRLGIDPVASRRQEINEIHIASEEAEKQGTVVKIVIDHWFSKRSKNWATSNSTKIKSRLDTHIPDWFLNKPVVHVNATDVVTVLREAEQCSVDLVHRIRGYLRDSFEIAVANELILLNPVLHPKVTEAVPKKPTYNPFPHINQPPVIGEVLVKIKSHSGTPSVSAALRLLPYVFTRPGELRGMRWREIDHENRLWRIPPERMKARREHLVPLSKQAYQIIEDHRNEPGIRLSTAIEYDHVFPGRDGKKPISDMSLSTAMKKLKISSEILVPHGWRHTASSALNERLFEVDGKQKRFSPDAIEIQLAHTIKGVRGIYNSAEYLDERRIMLQAWADWLDSLRDTALNQKPIDLSKAS